MGHKGQDSEGGERALSQVGREQAGLWSTQVLQDTQEWLIYYIVCLFVVTRPGGTRDRFIAEINPTPIYYTNGLYMNIIVEYVYGLIVKSGNANSRGRISRLS
jgi:hypothetical protein